jgi:hypothetical protein
MIPTTDSTLLAQIEACIAQALAGLEARQRLVPPSPPAASAEPPRGLEACRQRVATLPAQALAKANALNQIDTELTSEEKTLRAFLQSAAALRQKLAVWTGRAIG